MALARTNIFLRHPAGCRADRLIISSLFFFFLDNSASLRSVSNRMNHLPQRPGGRRGPNRARGRRHKLLKAQKKSLRRRRKPPAPSGLQRPRRVAPL